MRLNGITGSLAGFFFHRTVDDFMVKSVLVTIKDDDGNVLEAQFARQQEIYQVIKIHLN